LIAQHLELKNKSGVTYRFKGQDITEQQYDFEHPSIEAMQAVPPLSYLCSTKSEVEVRKNHFIELDAILYNLLFNNGLSQDCVTSQ